MTAIPFPEVTISHEEGQDWTTTWQATNETGQPIGRPQIIVGKTQEELIQKLAQQNVIAARALNARRQKPELAVAPTEIKAPTLAEDITRQNDLLDSTKRRKTIRADVEAEAGISLDTIKQTEARLRAIEIRQIGNEWIANTSDFYQCDANNNLLVKYIRDNNMAFTKANLDIAFDLVRDQLIAKPEPEISEPEYIPPTRQKSVTTSLIPGEGVIPSRSAGKAQGLTWAEVDDLTYNEWQAKKRDPKWMTAYNKLAIDHPRLSR